MAFKNSQGITHSFASQTYKATLSLFGDLRHFLGYRRRG